MEEIMENLNVNAVATNEDNEWSDDESSDDESTNSEESESSEEKDHYVVLSPRKIVKHMSDIVDKTNSVLHLPPSTARILLHHFNWDKDKLLKRFLDDDNDQLFHEANVINPFKLISSTAKDEEKCSICYTVDVPAHMKGLGCGHSFCEECWNQYLTKKIVDEGIGQTITCAAFNCPILVDYETVMRLVKDANVKTKYQHLITNGFIESNRLTRWCSIPGCECAIKVKRIKFVPVVCKCYHTFCFSCGEDWHDPVNCGMLKKWLKKCNDDAENSIWLSANTKECPTCKTIIEKDGGCNHVICKIENCKAEFCWVCLGSWASHGGDYYNCRRYDEEEAKAARQSQEESRAELNRYAYFYNRYMDHKRWLLKFQHTVYPSAFDTLNKMLRKYERNPDVIVNRFYFQGVLENTLYILRDCRQTLMYTNVFAYYLKENNQSLKFKNIQDHLETAAEILSEYLGMDEFTHKSAVFEAFVEDGGKCCERRMKELLDHLHEGLEKQWWEAETTEIGVDYVF